MKNENSQIFQDLDQSEETFDHELGFFGKRASDLVLSSGVFRSFYFTETFQSHDIFDFLRSILRHFLNDFCKYSLESLLEYEVNLC